MVPIRHRMGFFLLVSALLSIGPGARGPLRAAPPSPLPCATEALAAIDEIRTLLGVLGLDNGHLSALTASLDAAEKSITGGKTNPAQGQLGALRNKIEAFAGQGDIAPGDAQALLAAVDDALAVVTTCSTIRRLVFFNVRSGDAENRLFWLNPTTAYASTRVLFRTDDYPTGPADPAATPLGTFPGTAGAVGSTMHAALVNGTTYYYAAFAEDGAGVRSAPKVSRGRPDVTAGSTFLWAYTVDRRLPIVGINTSFPFNALSNDALHSMQSGPNGGGWPAGWTPVRIPAPADARPAVTGSITYVSSRTGHLYAVNAATGAILWVSPALGGAVLAAPSGVLSGPNPLLFVGTREPAGSGKFYALKVSDGSIAWSFDNGGNLGPVVTQASVDAASSRLWFTSRAKAGTDTVWSLQFTATSATRVWSANPGDVDTSAVRRITTTPPIRAIYVGNTAGEIHALDVDTGVPHWSAPYNTGDGPVRLFVFFDRFTNRLFFSTVNQVHAIEDLGPSAQTVWAPPLTIPVSSVPVPLTFSVGNTRIYIPTVDGRIYEVDGNSVAPTPTIVTVGDPAHPSMLGALTFSTSQNIVGVGSADGVVYAHQVPFSP